MRLGLNVILAFTATVLVALSYPPVVAAQQGPGGVVTDVTPPEEPSGEIALPLPAGSAPGAAASERWYAYNGQPRLTAVTQPTLTPFLPQDWNATGAAIIVAPGGGFAHLAIEKEGWNVARWLADHGIAAFVLKYRVIPRDRSGKTTAPPPVAPETPAGQVRTFGPAAQDVRAAMRMVRSRGEQWNVDPHRVGVMGFSAGATLALSIALDQDPALRPDFILPIYAPTDDISVPQYAPPMFSAITADDGIFTRGGFTLVQAWLDAGRPVEFHLYENGGHGFGVPGVPGTTTTALMDQVLLWLQSRQIVAE